MTMSGIQDVVQNCRDRSYSLLIYNWKRSRIKLCFDQVSYFSYPFLDILIAEIFCNNDI